MGWPLGGTMLGASTAELAPIMEAIALAINQRQALITRGVNTEGSGETSWYYTDALSVGERKRRPTAADFRGAWIHGPCMKTFVQTAQAAIDDLVQFEVPGGFSRPVFLRERSGHAALTISTRFWERETAYPERDFHEEIGAWLDVEEVGVLRAELWQQLIDGLNLLVYVCTYDRGPGLGDPSIPEAISLSDTAGFPSDADAGCVLGGSAADVMQGAIDLLDVSEGSHGFGAKSFYFKTGYNAFSCNGDVVANPGDPVSHTGRTGHATLARGEINFSDWAAAHRGQAAGELVQFLATVQSQDESLAASKNNIIDLSFCGVQTFTPAVYPASVSFDLAEAPAVISLDAAEALVPLPTLGPDSLLTEAGLIYQSIEIIAAVTDITGLLDDQS